MSSGARNWPFLTLTTRAGARGGDEQVGLARQERRNLQDVGDLGDRRRPASASWMSVRIGTPAASLARARARAGLRPRPGPRNELIRGAVGLVERRLEDERHAGARGRCRASASADVDGVRFALDDARPGDEEQRCAAAERQRPSATGAMLTPLILPRTRPRRRAAGARPCGGSSPRRSRRTADAACSGLRLELRVELHRDVPRVAGQLDDLDELAVERAADDLQALVGQRLLVEAVELVAVAVALVDRRRRRRARCAQRARRQLAGVACRAASCRPGRRRRAGRAACRSPCVGVSGAHSVESASASPQTLRANSTVAHWKP